LNYWLYHWRHGEYKITRFMRNVLIIAGREIMRLRARFGGKMVAAVLILLAAAGIVSFFVYQRGMVLARDFYIVSAGSKAPLIDDQRFHVVPILENSAGGASLKDGNIDVFLTGTTIFTRQDSRSQYNAGALKSYLGKSELERVADVYPLNQAFPLRVEINYLKAPSGAVISSSPASLADVLALPARVSASEGEPAAKSQPESKIAASDAAPRTSVPDESDAQVRQQLAGLKSQPMVPEFKAEFAPDKQLIVPSLMTPPIPLAQVLLAFAYILPIFFISIFFTSGFIEEKMGRKINILLSTPVTPFQIIIGKMLPYLAYSLMVVIAITLALRGNLLLALAIFLPVMLFIFAIYLGVALQYRTFRDQTFFSLVAVTGITGYLVFPAMFVGINDLSYISPLTLAVQMYRGVEITPFQYMLSSVPMVLVFVLAVTIGSRVFNEEYLMSFCPIQEKIREAIYFAMDRRHLALSVAVFSLLFIPVVFMAELGVIALAFSLPRALALGIVIFLCVVVEEAAKSITVAVAIERGLARRWTQVVVLAVTSAAAFFVGEKLLLFMSLKVISESIFTTAIFASNTLWMPLVAHTACTLAVCLISYKLGRKGYPVALLTGSIMHGLYNLSLIGVFS
jgi:ABC-type Na+ efflux pump permease subunit